MEVRFHRFFFLCTFALANPTMACHVDGRVADAKDYEKDFSLDWFPGTGCLGGHYVVPVPDGAVQ